MHRKRDAQTNVCQTLIKSSQENVHIEHQFEKVSVSEKEHLSIPQNKDSVN